MIIVALRGGLGNQFFQYAAGRSVSLRRGVPLKLDLSWYESQDARTGMTGRAFELSHFRVAASRATAEEIAAVRQEQKESTGLLSRLGRKLGATHRGGWIRERKYFEFDPAVLESGPDAYLDGYWQNEKYFSPVADVIRQDLQPASMLSSAAKKILESIRTPNSVGVHVRRGDYADGTSAIHSVLDVDYFQKAVGVLSRDVPAPELFYFSDDPAWVHDYLSNILPGNIVSGAGLSAHEELMLMSSCRHQVIANSTFSWWAAWLNTSMRKVVVAPRRWFKSDDIDTSDLLPREWRAI